MHPKRHPRPVRSHVVTGGGRGVGRAITERLLRDGDAVVALDRDPAALAWVDAHEAGTRAIALAGDATDEASTEHAADLAEAAAPLAGWVNNAAVFRDASLHIAAVADVLDLIALNLSPALVGCTTAIRRFLGAGTPGAIVNVSSHQAQRAVLDRKRAGSVSTRWRSARSRPSATRPPPKRSTTSSDGSSRSAASAAPTRSPRSSPTC